MLTLEQIKWIREKKVEFKEKFNKDAEINISIIGIGAYSKSLEKKLKDEVKNYFEECKSKYKLTEEEIHKREKKFQNYTSINKRLFMKDFCTYVVTNNLHKEYAASLIKRDRSVVYYFADRRKI